LNFNIGLPNFLQNILLFFGSLFLLDLLLSIASLKLSLSTGRFQYFLLNQIGKNSAGNFLISMALRSFSFLEKAYLVQLKSWVSVGSFTMRQKFVVCAGGILGSSLLYGLFLSPLNYFFVGFGTVGCLMAFFWKREIRDLGFGILLLGLSFGLVQFLLFSQSMDHGFFVPWSIPLAGQIFLVFISYFLFKTLVPILVLISFFFFKSWVGSEQFVLFFTAISAARALAIIDFKSLKAKRLKYFLYFLLSNILLQPLLYLLLFRHLVEGFVSSVEGELLWSTSFFVTVVSFMFFELAILPLFLGWFAVSPWIDKGGKKKNKMEPQKIYSGENRNEVYSIHFLIHLLRQEFVKFATLTHTTFKLGKEVGLSEGDTFYRFKKYCSILPKVADELKSLCFSIGQQKTYSNQMLEVFARYRLVNQMELLVDDLEEVVEKIRPAEKPEGFQKDILRWFQNQLRVFEDFYFTAVGIEDPGMVESEEVRLEQVFSSLEELRDFFDQDSENWALLKTFHRMTDTNLGLRKNLDF